MKLPRSLIFVLAVAPAATAAPVDYTRDVRPILSQHCFKCHGPDDNARKAGLRLDRRPGDMGKPKSGEATIVPGQPDASELVRRIESDDDTEVMPPPATKKPLSAGQKAVLRQWIADGAGYKDHWSWIPPKQGEGAKVRQSDWPKNANDYFVLARPGKE